MLTKAELGIVYDRISHNLCINHSNHALFFSVTNSRHVHKPVVVHWNKLDFKGFGKLPLVCKEDCDDLKWQDSVRLIPVQVLFVAPLLNMQTLLSFVLLLRFNTPGHRWKRPVSHRHQWQRKLYISGEYKLYLLNWSDLPSRRHSSSNDGHPSRLGSRSCSGNWWQQSTQPFILLSGSSRQTITAAYAKMAATSQSRLEWCLHVSVSCDWVFSSSSSQWVHSANHNIEP